MMVVLAFPHAPDLVTMVNALAQEAGEPSTEELRAEIDASDQGTLHVPYTYVM